jgi:hypothetical protein
MGVHSIASGDSCSTAIGYHNKASGYLSTAMGSNSIATGSFTVAMGDNTIASALNSTAMGCFNLGGGNPTSWIGTDPLFEIGNGNYNTPRSNAMTVLKNGNVGIGTHTPGRLLHMYGTANPRILVETTFDQTPELNLQRGSTTHALYVNGNYDLVFYSAGDRVTITDDGKVGIGTDLPAYTLEVNGTAAKPGGGSWSSSSDIRLKDVLGAFTKGLNEIAALRPVRFTYKKDNPVDLPSDQEQTGFIAQEVMKIFPEAVSQNPNGYLDFNMHTVNMALVNAVRELKVQNEQQQSTIDWLEARLAKLESLLDATSVR